MKKRVGLVALTAGIAFLTSAWVGGTAQASDTKKDIAVVKKYPPYPDVWDWVTPFPARMSREVQAALLPDGDVQLSYRLKSKRPTPAEEDFPQGDIYSLRLFAKQPVPPPKAFSLPPHHGQWRVQLPNGKIIRNPGSGGGGNCFHLFDRVFTVADREENELAHKVLFYVLDHPATFVPSGMCEGMPYNDPPFSYRMVTMVGGLISLEDNTFLIVDREHGVVIRFDEQWQSKSQLLNQRIFVMDRQEMREIIQSKRFMKSKEETSASQEQPVDEEFYQYLMTLKGRR
jgi:hypothetical protein